MHEVQLRGGLPGRHVRAASVTEALQILKASAGSGKVIAGGTDLILEFERRQHGDTEVLIDLSGIPGLDTITISENHAEIGALVTHNQIAAHDELTARALPLVQACREIGSPQLRNRATVVGNVATASPANDTISALRVLDAEVVIEGPAGRRNQSIADFHIGVRQTTLLHDELITAIRFRLLGEGERGVFVKAGNRVAQAISVVHAAIVLDQAATPPVVRVALGSVAPTIVEFRHEGDVSDDGIAGFAQSVDQSLTPIDDVRATADYRRTAVRALIGRGIAALRDGTVETGVSASNLSPNGSAMAAAPAADLATDDAIVANVNGEEITAPGVGLTLLNWLRDQAGPHASISLTGTKEGCAEGECGACTVLVNGAAVMSCLVPAASIHGENVTTVEAVAPVAGLDPIQSAFVEHGAVQCGFCIPGFIVAGRALLDEVPHPSHGQIIDAFGGNLCRCTGYYKIIDAIAAAGATP